MAGKTFSLGDRVWTEKGWEGFILSVHYPPRPTDVVTTSDPEPEVMIYWTIGAPGSLDADRYSSMRRSGMRWVDERARWELK